MPAPRTRPTLKDARAEIARRLNGERLRGVAKIADERGQPREEIERRMACMELAIATLDDIIDSAAPAPVADDEPETKPLFELEQRT